eukprot:4295426-Prymnesium_polylepis.1
MRPQFPHGRCVHMPAARTSDLGERERPGGRGGVANETAEIHLPHVSESECVGVKISTASGGDLGLVGGGECGAWVGH